MLSLTKYIIPFSVLLIVNHSNTFLRVNDKTKKYFQQSDQVNCYCKGYKLYGRIQIVESFPDIKVQIVTSFSDLKVKIIEDTPSKCGEWKIVNEFPDLKVKFVTSFPDIKIQYVQSFPGMTHPK